MNKIHKISRFNLQQIYSKVCSNWQSKIDNYLTEQKFAIEISVVDSVIQEAYKQADKSQKSLIKTYFDLELPEDKFKNIKNYYDFCQISGAESVEESDFKSIDKSFRKKIVAQTKLCQIENFFSTSPLDWKDKSKYKYYPYFTINDWGGLVFFHCNCSYDSFAGVPAYFENKEIAKFVGVTFIDIYQDLI